MGHNGNMLDIQARNYARRPPLVAARVCVATSQQLVPDGVLARNAVPLDMGSVMTFTEFEFYDPKTDGERVRLSVFNHGREYFMFLDAGVGYRQRREAALENICEAIDMGLNPGEVRVQ